MKQLFVAILIACTVGAFEQARAQDTAGPLVLVAKAELVDKFYGKTVLLTKPIGGDRHVGFVLNKPTQQTLGTLFPTDPASKLVTDPVFLGGPVASEVIFALTRSKTSPGGKSIQMLEDLWLVMDNDVVDAVIQKEGANARYVAGMVLWKPGELDEELKKGLWHKFQASSSYVFRKDAPTMWEGLAHRGSMTSVQWHPDGLTKFQRVSTETIMKPIMPRPARVSAEQPVVSRNAAWVKLFTDAIHAGAREAGEDPKVWTIIDTGDSKLDPNGVEWPLVRISKKGQPNECLIAVGPEGWSNVVCMPIEMGGVKRFLN